MDITTVALCVTTLLGVEPLTEAEMPTVEMTTIEDVWDRGSVAGLGSRVAGLWNPMTNVVTVPADHETRTNPRNVLHIEVAKAVQAKRGGYDPGNTIHKAKIGFVGRKADVWCS